MSKNQHKKITGYKRAYEGEATGSKFYAAVDGQPPKGDPRKILFSSGTTVDYLCAIPAIMKKFNEVHGAWEAINREEYEDDLPDGTKGPLKEIRFTEAPPDVYTVQDWEDERTAAITAIRNDATTALEEIPVGTYQPHRLLDIRRSILAEYNKANLDMMLTKTTVEGQYKRDVVNWENKRRLHEKLLQDIQNIFNEVLGGQAAVIVERDVSERNFCAAILKLKEAFNVKNGGGTTQSIKQKIASAVFDAKKEHLSQHMQKIRNWCDALAKAQSPDGTGRATEENVKDDVINSIMNSTYYAAQYKDVIHSINFNCVTPTVALQKLHERAMELSDQKVHRKLEGEARVAVNHRDIGNSRGSGKICEYCQKPGHTEPECWKKNPCFICKKSGHNPKNCWSLKNTKTNTKKAANSNKESANNNNNKSSSVVLSDNIKKLNGYVMLSFNENFNTVFKYEYKKAQEDFGESGINIVQLAVAHVSAAQCTDVTSYLINML